MYIEYVTPETIKLLESTENKISIDKNDENAPHLEITKAVLVLPFRTSLTMITNKIPNSSFGQLLEIIYLSLISWSILFLNKLQRKEVH